MDNIFGKNMRSARIMEKIALQDLASETGIPKKVLYKYESGELMPDSETAIKIAEALKKTSNWMFWNRPEVELSNIKFLCKQRF